MAPKAVKERIAKAFLAQHLAVRTEDIVYEQSEKTIWSDTSLGCPQDGFVYADGSDTGICT